MVSQEGIASLKRLGVQLRGLLELADALEGVNSIEQSADEARGRLNSIGKQIEGSTAELSTLKEGIAAVNAEAEQIKAQALQHAEQVKALAEADARSVVAESNEVATAILTEAKQQSERVEREAQERAKTSMATADAAEARKVAFDKASAEKSLELQTLLRKLEDAKAQAARILSQ